MMYKESSFKNANNPQTLNVLLIKRQIEAFFLILLKRAFQIAQVNCKCLENHFLTF